MIHPLILFLIIFFEKICESLNIDFKLISNKSFKSLSVTFKKCLSFLNAALLIKLCTFGIFFSSWLINLWSFRSPTKYLIFILYFFLNFFIKLFFSEKLWTNKIKLCPSEANFFAISPLMPLFASEIRVIYFIYFTDPNII